MKLFIFLTMYGITISIHSEDISTKINQLLSSHPEILSLESELSAKKANTGHETTYPDPKIGIAFRNYPTRNYSFNDRSPDTPSMTGIEYSISQEIPFPGKLTLQGKTSKLNELEFANYVESKKNQFAFEYLSNQIRLGSAEKKVQMNDMIKKTLESQKVISSSSVITGNSNLSRGLKWQIEVTLSKEKEIEYIRDKKNAIASLTYFKSEKNNPILSEDEFQNFLNQKNAYIKSIKKNYKGRLMDNPNYKLASVAVERAKNESKIASLMHAPDTEIFFAYMKRRNQIVTVDNGPLNYQIMDNTEYRGDLFTVGMNVRVPVWSFFSNSDLKNRSSEATKSKSYELEKNLLFLESSFEKLLVTYESLESQISLHTKNLIPELERSLSALSSGYSSGKIDLLEVLLTKIEIQKAHLSQLELEERRDLTLLMLLELTNSIYAKGD